MTNENYALSEHISKLEFLLVTSLENYEHGDSFNNMGWISNIEADITEIRHLM